jgi:NAD(P)-dependent dehydrogenase (short-subunit alcohol dehydrogenase family)
MSEDRIVVVTGASDGIGAAASRQLARQGHRVVVVGRSPAKTQAIAAELGAESHVADFGQLSQVRELAAELAKRHARIDVLVNNAGIIAGPQRLVTGDGHELTIQVNHLAPFLLTTLLRDPLAAAGGSVITTSSKAGTVPGARVDPDDLNMSRGYNGLRAYQASKLANVLFTRELARRWETLGVSAAAMHPGLVRSGWGQSGPPAVRAVMSSPLRLIMRSPERGADTIVWLATTSGWPSGGYFADRKPARPHRLADDTQLTERLWEQSMALCGM